MCKTTPYWPCLIFHKKGTLTKIIPSICADRIQVNLSNISFISLVEFQRAILVLKRFLTPSLYRKLFTQCENLRKILKNFKFFVRLAGNISLQIHICIVKKWVTALLISVIMLIIIKLIILFKISHHGMNKHHFLLHQIRFCECLSVTLTQFKLPSSLNSPR
jgi:hypothetical protein